MQKENKIDHSKLFGFEWVVDQISEKLDLQEDTVSAKLGAKVGQPEVLDSPIGRRYAKGATIRQKNNGLAQAD